VAELLVQAGTAPSPAPPAVYLIASGARAEREALCLAERLRELLPGRGVLVNMGGGNFKNQFRRADKSGAFVALILGEEELDRGVAAVKPLRETAGQSEYPLAEVPARIAALF
jgi:histidyl-tRNA synthetase